MLTSRSTACVRGCAVAGAARASGRRKIRVRSYITIVLPLRSSHGTFPLDRVSRRAVHLTVWAGKLPECKTLPYMCATFSRVAPAHTARRRSSMPPGWREPIRRKRSARSSTGRWRRPCTACVPHDGLAKPARRAQIKGQPVSLSRRPVRWQLCKTTIVRLTSPHGPSPADRVSRRAVLDRQMEETL